MKKRFTVILILLSSIFILSEFTNSAIRGDLDGDGVVGLSDAIIILQVVAGSPMPTPPTTFLGSLHWANETLDVLGTVTDTFPGCRQDPNGIFWDFNTCYNVDCQRLGAGKVNCTSMCSNIKTENNLNNQEQYCTLTPTIIETNETHTELGRIEWSDDTGIVTVGTVHSSMFGCRHSKTSLFWDQTSCLDDCDGMAAGGLNCRKSCNLIAGDTTIDELALCTY